ncbi:MAG: hypothetical protein JM58_12875 [Peptococcaceae bacterium BICA1-8]|nr:MAG: hypothetical protein JM58_12875 [Peptococcaceae bacterium BICA1-8]
MNLKDIGEFGLIARLAENCIFNKKEILVGIGDDTAVLPLDQDYHLLVSCDMLIEKMHFLREVSSPFQIGYKSVAVNFSDIAAMGGWPTSILVSIGIPKSISFEYIDEIYKGMKNICKKYSVNIIGGDTVASPDGIVINVTVLGKVEKNNLHLRSHAKVDDVVFTTGTLGNSAAGLQIIKNIQNHLDIDIPSKIKDFLLQKHLSPEPCLNEIRILNKIELGLNALNDISDGLASEAWEIANASQIGIELYKDRIPISEETQILGQLLKTSPLDWALYGGEDFQLIGTIDKIHFPIFSKEYKRENGTDLFEIGRTINYPGVFLVHNEEKVYLNKSGFNHFD